MKPLYLIPMALLLAGCGSLDGETWLVRTGGQEITVNEAGAVWNGLDPGARNGFMSGDSPVGDFITALGRKSVIQAEVALQGSMDSPEMISWRAAYLRNSSYSAYLDDLAQEIRASLDDQEVELYSSFLGKAVWFTGPDGNGIGPVELQTLGREMALAFDTMAQGTSVELAGDPYTLDSVYAATDSIRREFLSDSSRVMDLARDAIVNRLVNESVAAVSDSILLSFSVDSAAVISYLTAWEGLEPSTVLASWEGGSLSVNDLNGISSFATSGHPFPPGTYNWARTALLNHAILSVIEERYSRQSPDSYSLLQQNVQDISFSMVSDELFQENVAERIQITEEMITNAFAEMDSLPVLPETRIFEAVAIPDADLDRAREHLAAGDDMTAQGFTGYTPFLAEGEEYLSRPVTVDELPDNAALVLFSLDQENTGWQEPVSIGFQTYVILRLVDVIPSHQAGLSDLHDTLEDELGARAREQLTMEWLCELEAKHGLEINSDILSDLPQDISSWETL